MLIVLPDLQKFGTSVATAALATALAAAASSKVFVQFGETFRKSLDKSQRNREKIENLQAQAQPNRYRLVQAQVELRIEEARVLRRQKRSNAKWSRFTAHSLTFAQYVIGGVLASSFIQQKTSPQIIGALGVLVLIASLLTQHYHPELAAQKADDKAQRLQVLIRQAEDAIVVASASRIEDRDDPTPMLDILEAFSSEVNRITTEGAEQPLHKAPRISHQRSDEQQ